MENRKNRISGNTYDEERALYHLLDTEVADCIFAGPADGESAFKEARDITVRNCSFSLRYPFWHTERFEAIDCKLDSLTRAPLWYSSQGRLENCEIESVKCLRECHDMTLENCRIVSPEFGWRCRDMTIQSCDITSEYFLFECEKGRVSDLSLHGKYSFQYTKDLLITDSVLDTKDAFWHAENVTVRNCVIKGEYLGWYSRRLTLEGCRIIGTQPLCYCEDLTLIDCIMENTDLAFEYSAVDATVTGNILSVKNPRSGQITADSIGEVILENSVMETDCKIRLR